MTDEQQNDAPPPTMPTITIELTPAGLKVTGNGAIQNPILAYGMLEVAKDTIRAAHAKKQESLIQRVSLMPPVGFGRE